MQERKKEITKQNHKERKKEKNKQKKKKKTEKKPDRPTLLFKLNLRANKLLFSFGLTAPPQDQQWLACVLGGLCLVPSVFSLHWMHTSRKLQHEKYF